MSAKDKVHRISISRWWVVIIGLVCLTFVLVSIGLMATNPSTAVLEEEMLSGETVHTVTVNGKYAVLALGCDRDSDIDEISYRLWEQKNNRTVFEGTTRVHNYDAEVGPGSPSFMINGRGEYNLTLIPTPEVHKGTYSVAMNRTDISQDVRVYVGVVSSLSAGALVVVGYFNFRRRQKKDETNDRIQWIEIALVGGTMVCTLILINLQ
jgi:hypothetical protein